MKLTRAGEYGVRCILFLLEMAREPLIHTLRETTLNEIVL